MKKVLMAAVIAAVLAVMAATPAVANEWLVLDTRQAAVYGATHMWRFTYKDLASSTTTAHFTNSIPAKYSVELVQSQLVTPFNTAHAYATNSVAVIVGDGSDTDLFLTTTELASDGTEVYAKYGPAFGYTITPTDTEQRASVVSGVTPQTVSLTYLNASTQAVTVAVVTNVVLTTVDATTNVTVTATAAAGELGRKLYASAGSLVTTFTAGDEALSTQTAGEVRLFFRVFDATKW